MCRGGSKMGSRFFENGQLNGNGDSMLLPVTLVLSCACVSFLSSAIKTSKACGRWTAFAEVFSRILGRAQVYVWGTRIIQLGVRWEIFIFHRIDRVIPFSCMGYGL